MRAVSTLTAIGSALCFAASSAHAVGFGRVSNATQLGQPLNFAASVRLEADERLPRECVAAEVMSGENRLAPAQVRVTLEGPADSLERSVRVTTSSLIDEPVVTVSVTIGCTAKVTRKFVAFIDPPLINAAQTAPIEPLPPQRFDSQVAPLVAMVQGGDAPSSAPRGERAKSAPARSRAPVPAGAGSASRGERETAAARPKPHRSAAVSRQPSPNRPVAGGPRLQLEAAAPVKAAAAASAPVPAASAAVLAIAEAASAVRADDAAQIAKERARLQSLEDGLAKLRSESQATQAQLLTLQARLKEAESERYANPLVYALAWLSALLALAVAALWWRQSRTRQSAQWWTAPAVAAPVNPAARPAPAEPAPASVRAVVSPATTADAFAVSTMIEEDDEPAAAAPAPVTRPAQFAATAPAPMGPVANEPPRELSVEELIDLEQQAEFFIVLGQDDAAIDLLMSHVRSDGGISPLPYLKLLEIYRRRGEDEAYQRIRERFNRRFNAYAPDWDADLQQGRALVDYPETIARLQQLWSSPVRVMETLDASLFRRNKTDETFDLPAYRELLFLYSIARDLAEHAGALPATGVDLLLPIDDPGEEPISRLSATTQSGDFQASDMMTMPLDLDVSFAHGSSAETMPSALHRTSPSQFSTDSNFLDFDLDAPPPAAKPPKPGSNR